MQKREAEESLSQWYYVSQLATAGFENERGLWAKGCGQPLEVGKDKKKFSSAFRHEHSPGDSVTLAPERPMNLGLLTTGTVK